ncbi:unnamed protein product, partial [Prorocentrum cordatum]
MSKGVVGPGGYRRALSRAASSAASTVRANHDHVHRPGAALAGPDDVKDRRLDTRSLDPIHDSSAGRPRAQGVARRRACQAFAVLSSEVEKVQQQAQAAAEMDDMDGFQRMADLVTSTSRSPRACSRRPLPPPRRAPPRPRRPWPRCGWRTSQAKASRARGRRKRRRNTSTTRMPTSTATTCRLRTQKGGACMLRPHLRARAVGRTAASGAPSRQTPPPRAGPRARATSAAKGASAAAAPRRARPLRPRARPARLRRRAGRLPAGGLRRAGGGLSRAAALAGRRRRG